MLLSALCCPLQVRTPSVPRFVRGASNDHDVPQVHAEQELLGLPMTVAAPSVPDDLVAATLCFDLLSVARWTHLHSVMRAGFTLLLSFPVPDLRVVGIRSRGPAGEEGVTRWVQGHTTSRIRSVIPVEPHLLSLSFTAKWGYVSDLVVTGTEIPHKNSVKKADIYFGFTVSEAHPAVGWSHGPRPEVGC